MAATVTVRRWTGPPAGPTKTDVTEDTTQHVTEDAHYEAAGTNPVPRPAQITTVSAVDTATDTLTFAAVHGRAVNDPVMFSGTVPGGVTAGVVYYVKTAPLTTTMTLSATPGGATLDITSATTGAGLSRPNFSYWVSYRLSVDVAPAGTLNNIKTYNDGAWTATGIRWLAALANVAPDAGYRQATGTLGTTGLPLNLTNHTGLTAAPENPYDWTQAAPKAVAGSTSTTGDVGDFIVHQVAVGSGAAAQQAPDTSTYIIWDET